MELHLKQWRVEQHESEQQPSAKIPKLFLEPQQRQQHSSGSSALPLFVPEPTSKVSSLSATFPRMGSYFSLAQRQELELQGLIYRYMLAGAAVPPELLQPLKKSLLHSPPYFFQHYSHYQQTPLVQSGGYWGRAAMDPEPGRCRRTDGKKWRCSRDVVAGHKYCERHMHRGRNRSRKPVEIPTPTTSKTTSPINIIGAGDGGGAVGTLKTTSTIAAAVASPLALVGPSIDLLPINQIQSSSTCKTDPPIEVNNNNNRSEGHILRHFFDDWPRSLEEPETNNASTCLSISMPGNAASDVSLKLSTGGNGDQIREPAAGLGSGPHQTHLNWATGWPTTQVASVGGPLAEALRSSNSNSSPTSVLHHLPRNSASETSNIST